MGRKEFWKIVERLIEAKREEREMLLSILEEETVAQRWKAFARYSYEQIEFLDITSDDSEPESEDLEEELRPEKEDFQHRISSPRNFSGDRVPGVTDIVRDRLADVLSDPAVVKITYREMAKEIVTEYPHLRENSTRTVISSHAQALIWKMPEYFKAVKDRGVSTLIANSGHPSPTVEDLYQYKRERTWAMEESRKRKHA